MVYIKVTDVNTLMKDLSNSGFSVEAILDGNPLHFGIVSSEEITKQYLGEIFPETMDVMICNNAPLLELVKEYDCKSVCCTPKKAKAR